MGSGATAFALIFLALPLLGLLAVMFAGAGTFVAFLALGIFVTGLVLAPAMVDWA